MSENIEWTCPHCDRAQTASNPNTHNGFEPIFVGMPAEDVFGIYHSTKRCLNDKCNNVTLEIWVTGRQGGSGTIKPDFNTIYFMERIIPRGASVPQPDYVPASIKEDYAEACLIRELSPKASATLSRRCLQGMIRDFAGISRGTLDAEIKALQTAVADGTAPRSISDESVQAIDHVRRIGNIGTHMEKDINVVIDVDAEEAQALTDLIELLLREWYVDRYNRQQRLAVVAKIRAEKDEAKRLGAAAAPATK